MKLPGSDNTQEGTGSAQKEVLGNIEVACQGKMLVHRPDAAELGSVSVLETAATSVEADLSSVRLKDSRQNANQSRLPGAVLTQQADYLAAFDVQVDI
jgi:hypothetical protein